LDASFVEGAGRWLIVFYFAAAFALNCNRASFQDHVQRALAYGTPFPRLAFVVGMAMQITACVLLAANWHADIGALMLIFFTVTATAIFHRFWLIKDPVKRNFSRLNVLSNIGMVGGLLLLYVSVRS
jgi:uncharacterized membrane protein YphA (DoxX/SURF4 family)